MRFLLRLDVLVNAAELLLNALDLIPRGFRLLVVQLHSRGARQPALHSVQNRHHHFQIA
jgi:hypothetical protein